MNVGTVTGSNLTVKIYDVDTLSGVPTRNIPHVTISGTVGSGAPILQVIVADGDEFFPARFDQAISTGCLDFAGLSFSSTGLRDITRVAVSVAGNIDAGAIRRIQALGRVVSGPTYTGGKITGNITATSSDFATVCGNFGFESFRAMGVVWAGDEISGTISATSNDSSNPGSLTWLLIGSENNPSIDGLLGDVRVDYGTIEKVHTAGPIGSATATPKIWAGRAITEIRSFEAADLGNDYADAVGNADIKADIRTGLALGTATATPASDGPLTLLITGGNLDGEVHAANVANGTGFSYAFANRGIIVGGAINAPINIKYNLETADIIAASIDAPVTIGVRLKGAIVATSPLGQIASVEIGYANEGLDEEDPEYDPVVDEYTALWPRGFTGSSCRPVDPSFAPPYDEYTHADWTAEIVHCGSSTFDGGSIDSVIRAASIGFLRIVELNALYTFGSASAPIKPYHPRIESPMIDELHIERIREGVVWSGAMSAVEGTSGWEPVWDPAQAYSSIGTIVVDCIGPAGDLWVDGQKRIEIKGDVLGQVHVPMLTDTVWIGGRLGLWTAFDGSCVNSYPGQYNYSLSNASTEDSPRDPTWTDEATAARGEIVIYEEQGLTAAGQVIINGGNDGGTWDGAVIVGDELGVGNRIVITADTGDAEFDAAFEAPYYTSPSGPLGGGAVGLAPFAFYPTDCTPAHNDPSVIMYTAFMNGAIPVVARWYGPVELPEGEEFEGFDTLAGLLNLDCVNPHVNCAWYPLESMFSYVKHPGGQKRAVGIKTQGAAVPKDGQYRFSYEDGSYARLVSDDVVGGPFVGLFPTGCDLRGYLFRVDADCNENTFPDSIDIVDGGLDGNGVPLLDQNENGILDECEGMTPTCAADWDDNGFIGVPDIFAFLAAWFAGCDGTMGCGTPNTAPCYCKSADYNGNASVDVPDIFAFLADWFALGPNSSCP